MMRILRTFWYSFAILALAGSGCRPEEGPSIPTSNMDLVFRLTYDGEPVVMEQGGFEYANGWKVRFTEFRCYLGDGALVSPLTNDLTDLFDIHLLDFSDLKDPVSASLGITLPLRRIPTGEYGGIRFGLGVPVGLNGSTPSRFFGSHPLADEELYSVSLDSYFFMVLFGEVDTDGDGQYDDLPIRYQPGSDALFQGPLVFDSQVDIRERSTEKLTVVIDLKKILFDGREYLDLAAEPQTTVGNMDTVGRFLMENFANALSLEP